MKTMQSMKAAWLAVLLGATCSAMAHGDADPKAGGAAKRDHHAEALGKPGIAANVGRTVDVVMSDAMRFSPARLSARQGETVRFVLKNEGRLKHEMVLGSIAELKAHAALMVRFPEMEHAEPNQASVEPGASGELIWQFTRAGTIAFACLQPGHYEAGMKGRVMVAGQAHRRADHVRNPRIPHP